MNSSDDPFGHSPEIIFRRIKLLSGCNGSRFGPWLRPQDFNVKRGSAELKRIGINIEPAAIIRCCPKRVNSLPVNLEITREQQRDFLIPGPKTQVEICRI